MRGMRWPWRCHPQKWSKLLSTWRNLTHKNCSSGCYACSSLFSASRPDILQMVESRLLHYWVMFLQTSLIKLSKILKSPFTAYCTAKVSCFHYYCYSYINADENNEILLSLHMEITYRNIHCVEPLSKGGEGKTDWGFQRVANNNEKKLRPMRVS